MRKYSRGPRQCRCLEIRPPVPGKPPPKCIERLLWVQAWMLHEITTTNGLLGAVPVGGGKTLVNCLSPLALRDAPVCLLMLPASVIEQFITDYQLIAEHFHVPGVVVHLPGRKTWSRAPERRADGTWAPVLHTITYNKLSDTENSAWIEQLQPNAIICDEVDAISDRNSSRTMRVLRYFSQYHATTRFVGYTGSLSDSSVTEYAHLAYMALREGSPLPVAKDVVDEWGRALDAVPNPVPAGALKRFLEPHEPDDDINVLRRAFRRRLAETPGFVLVEGTTEVVTPSGARVELSIRERVIQSIPPKVEEALAKVRSGFRPDTMAGSMDDEVIVDPLEQARCAREVASGMFYRWVFLPINGVPQRIDDIKEWYAARKLWNHELRAKMLRGELNLDSAKLCENAARRYWGELPPNPELPVWKAENWPRWARIKDVVKPSTEAVRLDPFLVDDAIAWGRENNGIIWYVLREWAQWAAERSGYPVYGPGSAKSIIKERGDRPILASIQSHGRGRDKLQFAFSSQLFTTIPSSIRRWQQALGRLERRGQTASEVRTEIYLHTHELKESLASAVRRGEYVQDTLGEGQKLLKALDDDIDIEI